MCVVHLLLVLVQLYFGTDRTVERGGWCAVGVESENGIVRETGRWIRNIRIDIEHSSFNIDR